MTENGATPGRDRVIAGVLLAATLVAFVPGLVSDTFVFDDIRFIPHNRAIRDLGNTPRFFTDPSTMTQVNPGTAGAYDIYRPMRTLSFAVDWALFGEHAVWYRIESLLWHLAAVLLAWLLLRRLLGDPLAAGLGAGLFALHPLQTQTVSWISSRGDLMAAVFLLWAALLLLDEGRRPWRSAGGLGLFALALYCKESAAALVLVVPAYDLILSPRGRIRPVVAAALLAVLVGYVLIRNATVDPQREFEAAVLLEAGVGTIVLACHALFPLRLLADTRGILPTESLRVPLGGLALGIAAAVVVAAFAARRRAPLACFGVLWAAFCLGPASGLVPLKSVAESRFAYLPLLGLGIVLGAVVRTLGRRGALLAGSVLLLHGAGTLAESYSWTSSVELWRRAVDREKAITGREAGAMALANLGNAYAEVGDHEAAIEMLARSYAVSPDVGTLANLAQSRWDHGQREESVETAREAVRLDPESVITRLRLGTLLHLSGRNQEAVEHLRLAAERAPDAVEARHAAGRAYLAVGDARQALLHLSAAVRLAPDVAGLHVLLGVALHQAGAMTEALEAYRRASELDPRSAEPHLKAGLTLGHMGETHAAIAAFERALDLDPECHAARGERLAAIALLEHGLPPDAIRILHHCLGKLAEQGDRMAIQAILSRPAVWDIGDVGLRYEYVKLLLQGGELAEARDRLREIRASHPDSSILLGDLGLVELRLGNAAAALPCLEKALEDDPESFVLRINLARAYRALGREEDARRTAEEAIERTENDDRKTEARLFLAGGE
jgi:tetratricopeptide (TPR) repeat protein